MTSNWITRLNESISAIRKWALSFLKQDWELSDYPIRIREQEFAPVYGAPHFKQARYRACIINWWVMDGTGDTREEAICDLKGRLDIEKTKRKQQGKTLPRPGSQVQLEYASQDEINKHQELSEDFVRRILDLEWAWISDESSLWHFHTDETSDRLIAKIKETYGVDVSDIESQRLSEILERIAATQSPPTK